MRCTTSRPIRRRRTASPRPWRGAGLEARLFGIARGACAGGPAPELGIGSRVRVRVDLPPRGRTVDGFLHSVSDDSLVLDPLGPVQRIAIPRASLRSLEVCGPDPADERTVQTASEIGCAAGVIAAAASRDGNDDEKDNSTSLGELAAGYLGVLVVGGATRLVTGGGDEWHTIPVSRLDALTRGRHDGPVTISLPAPVAEDEAPAPGPDTQPDSVVDLESRRDDGV